jgi:redox-sensitive bicupin YhaK (pirin superfamily)
MSAGTGVQHSEFNASASEPVHFVQIWIVPERTGLPPGYEQQHFDESSRRGVLKRVAAGRPAAGEVKLFQDVDLYASLLEPGESIEHPLKSGRHAWIQVARGAVALGDDTLREGDGAASSGIAALKLRCVEPAEILLFDLG